VERRPKQIGVGNGSPYAIKSSPQKHTNARSIREEKENNSIQYHENSGDSRKVATDSRDLGMVSESPVLDLAQPQRDMYDSGPAGATEVGDEDNLVVRQDSALCGTGDGDGDGDEVSDHDDDNDDINDDDNDDDDDDDDGNNDVLDLQNALANALMNDDRDEDSDDD
jgi:hypothetical protein